MAMWTTKRPRGRGSASAWEDEERRERTRHAVWLVEHGAPMAVVAAECGLSYEALRKSMRRRSVA